MSPTDGSVGLTDCVPPGAKCAGGNQAACDSDNEFQDASGASACTLAPE